jgi:hypothetical protein
MFDLSRKSPNRSATSLSQDAAIVLALASTSLPFARSEHAQAERWLRVLRLHGQVGRALQALGVGEAPLETTAEPRSAADPRLRNGSESVDAVTRTAMELARRRQGRTIGTVDVLFAVFDVYGAAFDRALYVRGASKDELVERLLEQAGVLQ